MPRFVLRSQVVAEVARIERHSRGRTVFVGIDGFGASGKTSLAAAVAAAIPRAEVVHVDDFSGPTLPEWDWRRFDEQLVTPLLAGRAARYQRWNWDRDAGGQWRVVPVGSVLVVEGVSSTRAEVRLSWDLTIWVDAPRDVRLARALERDGPAMLPRWLEAWMPSEAAYATRERPRERVDLVVDGFDAQQSAAT